MNKSNDIWVEYILKYSHSHKDGTMKKWCEMMWNDGNMIEKCQQMMKSGWWNDANWSRKNELILTMIRFNQQLCCLK